MVRRLPVRRWRPPAIAATSVPWQNPLWPTPLPRRAAVMGSNGWRSPYPPVTFKALVRPWWFMGRSSLKPKNQSMGVRPRCPALVTPYAT